MAKSAKRQQQALEDRKYKKVIAHLEMLGAAYCRATDIPPTQACLVTVPGEAPGEVKYWFDHFTDRINDQTAHPDVRSLMSLAIELSEAYRAENTEMIKEWAGAISDFLTRYEAKTDSKKPEDAVESPKAESTAQG
jgi:hypothetical protein